MKLRYVSKRLRSVSEAPSLWREFIWPCYDRSEERCVCNVLKTCGQHMETLSFPGYVAPRVAPSKLIKSFNYCGNVKHFSLPAEIKLSIEQLREILQHMKCLKTLDAYVSNIQPKSYASPSTSSNLLTLTAHLQEVTFHLSSEQCGRLGWYVIKDWIVQGFNSKNLNIIMPVRYNHSKVVNTSWVVQLLNGWARHNADIPADHTAYISVLWLQSTIKSISDSSSCSALLWPNGYVTIRES